MLVLVTRPVEQAAATARALVGLGHQALVDPVLDIREIPPTKLDPATFDAVAVTSLNAVYALAGLPATVPVFAVGQATGEAIAAATGRRPAIARGDGGDLAALIAEAALPAGGAVLHLAGAETSASLADGLIRHGFAYHRMVVYEAVPRLEIDSAVHAVLAAGKVDAVLLYSPRSARLWSEKITRAGLLDHLQGVVAACLSPAVARGLAGLDLGEVRVAATPDSAALLRCLEAP